MFVIPLYIGPLYIGPFSLALVESLGVENSSRITEITYFLQGAAGRVGTPVHGVVFNLLIGNAASGIYSRRCKSIMVASTVTVF